MPVGARSTKETGQAHSWFVTVPIGVNDPRVRAKAGGRRQEMPQFKGQSRVRKVRETQR